MYTVYIVQSEKTGRYYVGMTADLKKRLAHHNTGANQSTRNKGPWVVVHREELKEKADAWVREKQIKSYKGGVAFKKLIGRIA